MLFEEEQLRKERKRNLEQREQFIKYARLVAKKIQIDDYTITPRAEAITPNQVTRTTIRERAKTPSPKPTPAKRTTQTTTVELGVSITRKMRNNIYTEIDSSRSVSPITDGDSDYETIGRKDPY